jgi:hypothetical protein
MALIYLDQNALIAVGRKARHPDFRRKLDIFAGQGQGTIVLNWWHLIESSYGASVKNCEELGNFIESLRCSWLLERFDILRLDVADDFCRFANISTEHVPRIVSFSGMLARFESQRPPGSIPFQGGITDFILKWRKHRIEQGQAAEEAYASSEGTGLRLREFNRLGKLTKGVELQPQLLLVESALPSFTPAGLLIGPELHKDYLHQLNPTSIPTVALDTAISRYEWGAPGAPKAGTGRNVLIDRFHLISATPYVDEIISDDRFFSGVYAAIEKTGYVRAKLSRNRELLDRIDGVP